MAQVDARRKQVYEIRQRWARIEFEAATKLQRVAEVQARAEIWVSDI